MSNLKFPVLAALVALGAFALAGCQTPEVCTDLGQCGGDLLAGKQKRTFAMGASCLNEVAANPPVPSLVHQSPTLAGEVPPRRTQVNFCSEMVMTAEKKIKIIQPWFPSIPIEMGEISYESNGKYTVSINYRDPVQQIDFAAGCFLENGYKIVTAGPTTVDTLTCAEFEPILQDGLATQPNISEIRCVSDNEGGCQCTYNLLLITSIQGTWKVIGNTITHTDTVASNPPSSADYCIQGNSLELTGYKRQFLFNQPALRTLQLTESSSN